MNIPGWLVRDVEAVADIVPTEVRSEELGGERVVRFRFGTVRLLYDRLGLRPAVVDIETDIADA